MEDLFNLENMLADQFNPENMSAEEIVDSTLSEEEAQVKAQIKNIFRKAYDEVMENDGTVRDFVDSMLYINGPGKDTIEEVECDDEHLVYHAKFVLDKALDVYEDVKATINDLMLFESEVVASIKDKCEACTLDTPLKDIDSKAIVLTIKPLTALVDDYLGMTCEISFAWYEYGERLNVSVAINRSVL